MLWMSGVSFRGNLRKYSLAMLSLALAVTVSCLGLSGLDLLQRSTLEPLTFIAGGQIMIVDARTNLRPAGARLYADPLEIKPFSADQVVDAVTAAVGQTQAVQTLVAPFMRYGSPDASAFYLAARDGLPQSLSSLQLLEGEHLQPDGASGQMLIGGREYVSTSRVYISAWDRLKWGDTSKLTIPVVRELASGYDWNVAAAVQHPYSVAGIYDDRETLYPLLWTNLPLLQRQVGGERPVSWIGIPCSPDQMEDMKSQLEREIGQRGLALRVLTLRDLGEMLIGDFQKFEQMADYYAPVMLLVAVQIVLVNAVALAMSRRKELALLRTIGFSLRQIQLMFVSECFLTAAAGGLIGTGLAGGLALTMTKNPAVSVTPFVISVITTTIVSSVTTLILTGGSLSQTLRNPAA